MDDDLKRILIILAVAIPVGSIVGIYLRKKRPDWCKSAAKYTLSLKWWFYALSALLFLGTAILSFVQDRPSRATFFLIFVCLDLYVLVTGKFNRLTPEMEAKIDASDPTKLWPLSLSKHSKNGEPENTNIRDK